MRHGRHPSADWRDYQGLITRRLDMAALGAVEKALKIRLAGRYSGGESVTAHLFRDGSYEEKSHELPMHHLVAVLGDPFFSQQNERLI